MNAPTAPIFVPNTALTSAALNAAQRYHMDAGRRHRAGAHLPGVIHGLTVDTSTPELLLRVGYAVDAFGRDLIVREARSLRPILAAARARDPQADSFRVLLSYQQVVQRTGTSRVLDETPRPDIQPAAKASAPVTVDLIEPAPDDPSAAAPVRLGLLRENPEQRDSWIFIADAADRQEAGLVASTIVPTRDDTASRLELSREAFAVVLASQAKEDDARRLIVDQHGAELRGALTVQGSVEVANQIVLTSAAAAPQPEGVGLFLLGPDATMPDRNELRLLLPPDGTLEIGAWNPESNKFEPLLTVDAGTRSVTVAGDLIVEGALVRPTGEDVIESSAPPASSSGQTAGQNSEERTVTEVLKGWLSTTAGSGVRLLLLLALAYGFFNWDRALTTLLPCDVGKSIRERLGFPVPICAGNILFSTNCPDAKKALEDFTATLAQHSTEPMKGIFGKDPDVTVYCPKK
jgi:hypothetical protein